MSSDMHYFSSRSLKRIYSVLLAVWFTFVAVDICSRQNAGVFATKKEFDCPMRELALEFALEIQPWLTIEHLQEIADALNGSPEANDCHITPQKLLRDTQKPGIPEFKTPPKWNDLSDIDKLHARLQRNPLLPMLLKNQNHNNELKYPTLFVDYKTGDDSNAGDIQSPLKHLDVAIDAFRRRFADAAENNRTASLKRIILREGRHYLRDTIHLTEEKDSHLLVSNFNGERSELSAGLPIHCLNGGWKLWKSGENNKNYYSCQLDATNANFSQMNGLRVNGTRAIRARYPNANPELDGFGSTLLAKSWLPPKTPIAPMVTIYPDEPLRNDTSDGWFQKYNLGIGGICDYFTPDAGYWCSSVTQGGGAFTYRVPTGLVYNSTILPNAPYNTTKNAVVQVWRPAHWASWMFNISDYDATAMTMKFDKGGFQGARGNNNGAEFYIEGVFEELDYETEWYYDTDKHVLYYYNNESNQSPDNLLFEATNLKIIFNVSNTNNINIRGLTMRDTQYTYLDPHGMPSGGDWGLQRQGAITLDNCHDIQIEQNVFTRLDGNAISINRYNRDVVVSRNEIVWNGDNGISNWGDTVGISFPNSNNPTQMGWDGTQGNQPRGVVITGNFVHEIGIWEKQSSMYFQAKSCSNVIMNNIGFNIARAGINFNDGFGGNSTVHKNLLFNTCRESGDHGPFNSWDRQVYVTKVLNGSPSTIKEFDFISQNFLLANYNAGMGVDNDDGSAYYRTFNNFLVYGANGQKSGHGGHDNYHYNNIYAYIENGWDTCFWIDRGGGDQLAGHVDMFQNNTCIFEDINSNYEYGKWNCSAPVDEWPLLGNNVIHTPNNHVNVTGLCQLTEEQFQGKYGRDIGTVVLGPANDTVVLQEAHTMLWM